ncbi:SDR family oxidoreductase [Lentilitoribacter sp. EG35]|uniref:SDR family oxidoreductase n=1 Tax=Lentilitoribacter sp. EG35 TaxID=3234192 RepID=UPI0034617225
MIKEENKIALITGASRGLGRSMALHLAKKGVGVVITYHSSGELAEEVVAEIRAGGGKAQSLQLDTGELAQFDRFIESLSETLNNEWGRKTLDYLVNNAGIGILNTIADTQEAEFDQLMNIHFKGVFFLTQRLLPTIEDGGQIVNISTGLTRFSMIGLAAYASMKGAIEVFTRYLAQELGPRNISVNTVAPGAIETDFGGGMVRDDPIVNDFVISTTARGRVGMPDDIGGMVASLLTGDNQWMTAQRLEVSGGQQL